MVPLTLIAFILAQLTVSDNKWLKDFTGNPNPLDYVSFAICMIGVYAHNHYPQKKRKVCVNDNDGN